MSSPYENAPTAVPADVSIFVIKDIRSVCRARTLRLQSDDIIIAVEGKPFKGDVELFLDLMFECDPDDGVMLSIVRENGLFHVIARGTLGCTLEYAKPEQAEAATKIFAEAEMAPREDYRIFEVLRDINRNCVIIDTEPSQMAMYLSPVWLIQNKLWEVLLAVILIYGATLTVSWMLFVIAVVLLALYFKQSQIVLQRSFNLMRQRQMWMIVAATSLEDVQRTCRQFDPKANFGTNLVGPPLSDEPAKKKRRRRPHLHKENGADAGAAAATADG